MSPDEINWEAPRLPLARGSPWRGAAKPPSPPTWRRGSIKDRGHRAGPLDRAEHHRLLGQVTSISQQIADVDLKTLAGEMGALAQGDLTRLTSQINAAI